MGVELKSSFVQFDDSRFIFFGIPEKGTFCGRHVGVRVEEGGGVRFHDAVEEKFDAVYVDPRVVKLLPGGFDGLNVFQVKFGRFKFVSDLQTDGELFVVAQFLNNVKVLKIAARAVDSRDTVLVGPFYRGAESPQIVDVSGLGNDFGDQVASRFLEGASGFAGGWITNNFAVSWIGRGLVDIRQCQSLGIGPIGVTVVALEKNGNS